MKIIAFDLDDVLCFREKIYEDLGRDKYAYCQPIDKNIKLMNECYEHGYYIKIYTARGMNQFSSDVGKIKEELLELTKNHLKSWGAKYHELIFGKEHYDLLVDDKVVNILDIQNITDIENKIK